MTNHDFYEAIVNLEGATEEMKEFAKAAIVKLDAAKAKRKGTLTKKQKENLGMLPQVVEVLTTEPQTAMAVGEALGVTTPKATALLKKLVEQGIAVQTEIKVTGKPAVKGYALIEDEDEGDEDEAEVDCAECQI